MWSRETTTQFLMLSRATKNLYLVKITNFNVKLVSCDHYRIPHVVTWKKNLYLVKIENFNVKLVASNHYRISHVVTCNHYTIHHVVTCNHYTIPHGVMCNHNFVLSENCKFKCKIGCMRPLQDSSCGHVRPHNSSCGHVRPKICT